MFEGRKLKYIVIAVVVVLIIGAAGYYFVLKQDKKLGDIIKALGEPRQADTVQVFDSAKYEYSFFADIANELIRRLRQ